LDQQCFVVFECAQLTHDRVEAGPVACRFAGAAVDDQIVGTFSDVGI
jgi:hypothetical protein